MKGIKRIALWGGIGLSALLLVLILGRNLLIQHGASAAVKAALGLDLTIGEVQVGLLETDFRIRELVVRNPPGFGSEPLARVPLIYVDYELGSLFSGKLHCTRIEVEVAEVSVVQDASGATNLLKVKALAEGGKQEGSETKPEPKRESKPMEMRIDKLILSIGRVRYLKLKGDGSVQSERNLEIGLDHEVFEDLTSPRQIVKLVLWRAVKSAGLNNLGLAWDLLGPSLDDVKGKAMEALEGIGEGIKKGAKGLQEGASGLWDKLKKGLGGED